VDNKFDIFISYSHHDAEFAAALRAALTARGISVWVDTEQIRPGDWFAKALETALASARAIAILISSQSLASGWVNEEYYRALSFCHQTGLRLIPVLIEDSELPSFLGTREYVDFRDPENFEVGIERLIWGISGKNAAPFGNSETAPVRTHSSVVRDSFEIIWVYAAQYGDWFLSSLASPSTIGNGADKWAVPGARSKLRLIAFLFVSVVIGSSISAAAPNRIPMIDRASVIATLAVMSIFVGLVVHCFCIVFGGTGTPARTVFTVMQVLALIYVVSSFLALLVSSGMLVYMSAQHNAQRGGPLHFGSESLLVLQFVLLLFYIPLSLRSVHGFNRATTIPQTTPSSTHKFLASTVVVSTCILAVLGLLAAALIAFVAWLISNVGGC
jgi:hypothetical protein